MTSSKQEPSWIYFCPGCHNIRVKETASEDAVQYCNKCGTEMKNVCEKKSFDLRNIEDRKKIISSLKSAYPEAAAPGEILLKRLNESNDKIAASLNTIKNILLFFFVLTLIGLLCVFIMAT